MNTRPDFETQLALHKLALDPEQAKTVELLWKKLQSLEENNLNTRSEAMTLRSHVVTLEAKVSKLIEIIDRQAMALDPAQQIYPIKRWPELR